MVRSYDPLELAADVREGRLPEPPSRQGLDEWGFVVLDHLLDGHWLNILCYRDGSRHPHDQSDRGAHFIDDWHLFLRGREALYFGHASLLEDDPDEATFLPLTDGSSFVVGSSTMTASGPELVELGLDQASIGGVARVATVVRLTAGVRWLRPVVVDTDAPLRGRAGHGQGWLVLSTTSPIRWIELEGDDGSFERIGG